MLGHSETLGHPSGAGEAHSEVKDSQSWLEGPWAWGIGAVWFSGTGHPGTTGCCGRAENRIWAGKLNLAQGQWKGGAGSAWSRGKSPWLDGRLGLSLGRWSYLGAPRGLLRETRLQLYGGRPSLRLPTGDPDEQRQSMV